MLALLLFTALAADPCKRAKETVDPDEGTIVEIKGPDWAITLADGEVRYETQVFRSGPSSGPLKAGWSLDTKLADGSAVRLSLETAAEPMSHTSETGSFTRWTPAFPVDTDTVEKLAETPMEMVRMDLGAGPVRNQLPRGRSKKLQRAFACVVEKM